MISTNKKRVTHAYYEVFYKGFFEVANPFMFRTLDNGQSKGSVWRLVEGGVGKGGLILDPF